jgi:hypothetical protein
MSRPAVTWVDPSPADWLDLRNIVDIPDQVSTNLNLVRSGSRDLRLPLAPPIANPNHEPITGYTEQNTEQESSDCRTYSVE